MKVLITGSAGFVGRHLQAACEARGDEVLAFDIKDDGGNALRFFREDRGKTRLDLVLHCAAYVRGRNGIDGRPAHLHTYNTMLDASMFNWALRAHPGRVVYFSSSAAYPSWMQSSHEAAVAPLGESLIDLDALQPPETSYGRVKLHGEQMAVDVRAAGVPVTVLRPFSGYGADQSLDYPFPSLIARARARENPITVWGSGDQVRDWIHIDDIVAATLKAADEGVDGPVNLCTGIGTPFLGLAIMIGTLAGYGDEVNVACDTTKPAGVGYRVGDTTRLWEFYRPQVHLAEGIQRALMA
jgi:nucleoside-diphosphate-sugar epimerase